MLDPADGLWHMAVAQMLQNCDLWSWKNNSAIVHVVSKNLGGPYSYMNQILPPFAHNPKLYAMSGGWILFAIGGALWNPEPETCSPPAAAAVNAMGRPLRKSPWKDGLLNDPSSPQGDGCGPEPPLNGEYISERR